jgi:hypothetical protein
MVHIIKLQNYVVRQKPDKKTPHSKAKPPKASPKKSPKSLSFFFNFYEPLTMVAIIYRETT